MQEGYLYVKNQGLPISSMDVFSKTWGQGMDLMQEAWLWLLVLGGGGGGGDRGHIRDVIDTPFFTIRLIAILFPIYQFDSVQYPVSWPYAWVKYNIPFKFS